MNHATPRRSMRLHPLVAGLAIVLATGGMHDAMAAKGDGSLQSLWSKPVSPKAEIYFQQKLAQGKARARAVENRPAATVAVTSCADDGSSGTLRDVLDNAVSGDVVDLTALTCSAITLATGGLAVNVDDLTLRGPGAAALAIDGDAAGTVINHYGSGTLTVEDLTITNGSYYFSGAGMWIAGDVVLNRSAVTNNHSHTYLAYGGGIFAKGSITLNDSTLANNSAISSDKYNSIGGGAYSEAGDVTISGSRIIGNVAGDSESNGIGGGFAATGNVFISNSTMSGNIANVGGVAAVERGGGGGPLRGVSSTTTVINSTISGNSAAIAGGGIALEGGLQLLNSTVAFNTGAYYGAGGILLMDGSSAVIQSSIVANNSGGGYLAADIGSVADSPITIGGANNLIMTSDAGVPADTLSVDPQLGSLANNGGPTATHALSAGSPAIDAGNNSAGLAFDQRGTGFARVVGAQADIGAFEAAAAADPDPGTGPGAAAIAVPSASTWSLGLLAGLLALVGLRRGLFTPRAR